MEFYVRPAGYNKHHVTLTDDSAKKLFLTYAATTATFFAVKYGARFAIRHFRTN